MITDSTTDTASPTRAGLRTGAAGATVFLVAYLLVSPVSSALADRALPLPDAPDADVVGYLAANPAAAAAAALLQVVSVAGLVTYAAGSGLGHRARLVALAAAVAMVASSLLVIAAVVGAGSWADETVVLLRRASFYSGGVVHVVLLGAFTVLTAGTLAAREQIGRFGSVAGRVAGVLAVLSILSIAFYYANAFLPIGRLACMVWAVAVGFAVLRRSPSRPRGVSS